MQEYSKSSTFPHISESAAGGVAIDFQSQETAYRTRVHVF